MIMKLLSRLFITSGKFWVFCIFFCCISGIYSQGSDSSIFYVTGSSKKICQLVGDTDRQFKQPTQNLTNTNYSMPCTDLGSSFEHDGRLYFLFGDIPVAGFPDPIAFSTDTTPEDGIGLTFVTYPSGVYKPVDVPGINHGPYEIPVEGVSVNGKMYVYLVTNFDIPSGIYERSVVAVSTDSGSTFEYLYNFSDWYFMNVSVDKVKVSDWPHLPQTSSSEGLLIFGAGNPYRGSDVRLAFQPVDSIDSDERIKYLTGLDGSGNPVWGESEYDAVALFTQPCVGEFSVSYNEFVKKWIMMYNCLDPRGINFRSADFPWGPWSAEQVLFNPGTDSGYCYFMHASWNEYGNCDSVFDPGRENDWGGEYGPYQIDKFATGTDTSTTIYFTMSTWNPYTVVLMRSALVKRKSENSVCDHGKVDNLPFSVFPNPLKEQGTISFSIETTENISVSVYDQMGRMITTLFDGRLEKGTHNVDFKTGDLCNGLYNIVMTSDTKKYNYKLVVLK